MVEQPRNQVSEMHFDKMLMLFSVLENELQDRIPIVGRELANVSL